MKKIIKKALLIVCVSAILSLSLVSCGKAGFDYEEGKLVNRSTGEKYTPLPVGFEPCGVGEECGKYGEFSLYYVLDLEGNTVGEDWITEEYAGSATTVFLKDSSENSIPDFKSLDFDVMYICEEDVNVISIATIDDGETIAWAKNCFDLCDEALWPRTESNAKYTLKLYSEDFPAVMYSLVLSVDDSGSYIYDNNTKKCVFVGDFLSEYISDTVTND